jgi:hypothetical protein
MTISLRAIKQLMRDSAPDMPLSNGAIALLKEHIEEEIKRLAAHSSKIQLRENEMRRLIGDRPRKRLSKRSLQMAIDGKYPGLMMQNEDSET